MSDYTIFKIPKRNGKFRTIEAPNDELKARQKEVLALLSKELKPSPFSHAFTYYKNIATMAMPHVGKEWVACIDIEDFFPSVKFDEFRKHGVKLKNVAPIPIETVSVGFHDFHDGKGCRLPQGAPTSPFLSNIYLLKFDWQIAWLARDLGCDYSRYADDLVFSGEKKENVYAILKIAQRILKDTYNLRINKRKTKVMHRKQRQLVCGVVVNEKLNPPRKWRKRLRAEIHQQEGGELRNETKGRIAFRDMVLKNKKETNSSIAIINSIKLSKELNDAIKK